MLGESTRWAALPVAGGWYDQHPEFVRKVQFLFGLKAEYDKRRSDKNSGKGKGPTKVPMG
jgi:hypothetical protein